MRSPAHGAQPFDIPKMQIPKIKLVPTPETPEAKTALGYAWNKEIGFRHFLGGSPGESRPQEPTPICSDCKLEMTFYAQLDSIGDRFDLADGMVIHTFVCFDCFTVQSRLTQI